MYFYAVAYGKGNAYCDNPGKQDDNKCTVNPIDPIDGQYRRATEKISDGQRDQIARLIPFFILRPMRWNKEVQ